MSSFEFIASDYALTEVENRKVEYLSIEEAEKRKIHLPNWYSKNMNIDRQAKTLLHCENEDCLNEITIYPELYYDAGLATRKKYIYGISWRYSDERATQLIEYIERHLQEATEIELWNIWLDEIGVYETTTCNINLLKKSHIKYINDGYGRCLIVKK